SLTVYPRFVVLTAPSTTEIYTLPLHDALPIWPMPMISGSTPATAKERNTARGVNPSSWALSADMTTTHAAPSLVWDELPAVTVRSEERGGGQEGMERGPRDQGLRNGGVREKSV